MMVRPASPVPLEREFLLAVRRVIPGFQNQLEQIMRDRLIELRGGPRAR